MIMNASTTSTAGCQGEVLRLVSAEAWREFRLLLASESRDEEVVRAIQAPLSNEEVGKTVLHVCCKLNPPMDVVGIVTMAFPMAVYFFDGQGRSPLHVAVKHGASPDVIHFLLQKNASVANVQDMMGMTPLHLACESYAGAYKPVKAPKSFRSLEKPLRFNTKCSPDKALLAAVKLLSRAAPETVTMEDENGFSALEYAIENENLEIVQMLQKVAQKHWKSQSELQALATSPNTQPTKEPSPPPAEPSEKDSGAQASLKPTRREPVVRFAVDLVEDKMEQAFELQLVASGSSESTESGGWKKSTSFVSPRASISSMCEPQRPPLTIAKAA